MSLNTFNLYNGLSGSMPGYASSYFIVPEALADAEGDALGEGLMFSLAKAFVCTKNKKKKNIKV